MLKYLSTKDSVLESKELESYLKKIAANENIVKKSSRQSFPLKRVKENYEYIKLVYKLLEEHIKVNIMIYPAGEWIIDNFYIVEKSYRTTLKKLKVKEYENLPGDEKTGVARAWILANEIITNTDGMIDENELISFINAYQSQKELKMCEIWAIETMIQVSLIEKIRHICEKIVVSQMEKARANNIVKRIIENQYSENKIYKCSNKYPFIEYMSYRLKKMGEKGRAYLKILEDEVEKQGISVSEIIRREHFDMAVNKLSMENAILSLKNVFLINMENVFNHTSFVERKLLEDPSDVYKKMTTETKVFYRNKIAEISKRTKTSEIYVVKNILELATKNHSDEQFRKKHVGYYIVDEGIKKLFLKIEGKKVKFITYDKKAKIYVSGIYIIAFILWVITLIKIGWITILLLVPYINAVTQVVQYFLSKNISNRIIPKIELNGKIPTEAATMCVIPVMINDKEKIKEIFSKLEIYYLSNKTENLFFSLLGDCSSSEKQDESIDKEIVKEGIKRAKELNEKYGNKFFFVYRKREWSNSEKCFMGWERKRGILNQLNEFLIKGKDQFKANTCKLDLIPKIKYVITLDEDTNLTLNSAFKMVGAMEHILNIPQIDKIKNMVIKGHAIIQPMINIDIENGRHNLFTRIFSGSCGVDAYTNAISNIYQDNFDEGSYTGKGIYNLNVFYEVLKDSIPENLVLSHDLLEGNFLRSGFASDIVLLDGFPQNYSSYKMRKHRWIRGDVQIIPWLNSSLNFLSKYKIIDNILRNTNNFFIMISLIIGMIVISKNLIVISFLLLANPMLISIFDFIYSSKNEETKLCVPHFTKIQHNILMFIFNVILLPDLCKIEVDAIVKSLYRMYVSHNFLLEWTTANEADYVCSKSDKIIEKMLFSVFIGFIFIQYAWGILWIFSPFIMIMLNNREEKSLQIKNNEKKYIMDIARKTWNFFKDNMVNYLISDNYQEDRRNKIVNRTSPTNIGLELMAIMSSYDLGLEQKKYVFQLIENVINQIEKIKKWNGHLYNWYDIQTLKPIYPYEISSVDSGNFVGYLFVLKEFLKENNKLELCNRVDKLIKDTNFEKLYSDKRGLLAISYNETEKALSSSCYDLLASEARQATLIAIAKRDIPSKSWNNLSRMLIKINKNKGLVSWGGTMFEYLMPNINIPVYESSILAESCRLAIKTQIQYAKELGIPWGISESAYTVKDFNGNYQYKTFGIPWLGIKRGLKGSAVISPYSTFLSMKLNFEKAMNNLKKLEINGMMSEYGFYESMDYLPKKAIVKTYMAHHQGMIISSINNVINNNIIQNRFMKNPEIAGIKVLLEEKMPQNIYISKKEKTERLKYNYSTNDIVSEEGTNILTTGKMTVITDKAGTNDVFWKDKVIMENNKIYLNNINNQLFNQIVAKNVINHISSTENKKITDKLKIETLTTIAPDLEVEIEEINMKNIGDTYVEYQIMTVGNPILSTEDQFNSHPTFSNMFLNFESHEDFLIVSRSKINEFDTDMYTGIKVICDEKTQYCIDKEKVFDRDKNIICCNQYTNQKNSLNPIIAFKTKICLKPNESKKIYLTTICSENKEIVISNIKEYSNLEKLKRVFELSKIQAEAETRYKGISKKDMEVYIKLYDLVMKKRNMKENMFYYNGENNKIWKYGISGDFPIIFVKAKDSNDFYIIEELVKAYEYYLSKNIVINIVIYTNDENIENIKSKIDASYFNTRKGMFFINNMSNDDNNALEARACVTMNAHLGSLEVQVREMSKDK